MTIRNDLLEVLNTKSSSIEFGLSAQMGLIPGVSVLHKFGRNPELSGTPGDFEALWNGGGQYTGFDATAAETIEVFSGSVNDVDSSGTGAHLVEVRGLGAGFVMQSEIIAMNGTTPVNTVNEYIRMDRALVLTAGSGGENAGEITVRQNVTTANVFAVIPIGGNRTLIAAYTVPSGKIAYVIAGFASMARKQTASCDVRARVRVPGSVFQVVEYFTINSAGSSYVNRDFKLPLDGVPAGTDFFIESDADSPNVGVAGGFEVILVDV